MKIVRRLQICAVLFFIISILAVLLTGCSKAPSKEELVTVSDPFDTFLEENRPAGMEKVDSGLQMISLTLQDGSVVSEEPAFQANLYTYLAPQSETEGNASESSDQKCTVLADVEFMEKVTITSDCYLKISLDDQVSPIECTGLLYYRDSPEEDWIFWKEQTGQPFSSFTEFTFLGSELKKDNKPHYYRLVATTNEADYYPTNNGEDDIKHAVIFYRDIPLNQLSFFLPRQS